MTVLVAGDCNVDMELLLPAVTAREHANPPPRLSGGGSAANTAAALGRLGVPCRFAGTVGDDHYGRVAVAELEAAGVDVSAVEVTTEDPTVMVMVVVRPDGERLIYVWPPTGGAHRWLRPDAAVAAVVGADWLHLSGIGLRVSPAREALLAAMDAAREAGIPVSLDLNLRLENWGWDDGFRSVVTAAVSRADVVVGAGTDEVAALAGIDDPVQAAAVLAGDRRLVVARLGAAGAVACAPGTIARSPGFPVQVLDTVGAGDAFNAGFITARLEGRDLEESLRWGNAVAALAITRRGARTTPTKDEVEALLAR
jgi:aminoimidazole riboside kinase